MNVFTVSETKIRFWEGVRDIPSLKTNVEASYGVEVDCYICREKDFQLSFDYVSFEVVGDEIHFFNEIDGKEVIVQQIGFPEFTDRELYEYYTFGEVDLIMKAKQKYSIVDCKRFDRYLNTAKDEPLLPEEEAYEGVPPADFPQIRRIEMEVEMPTTERILTRKVKVERYEG